MMYLGLENQKWSKMKNTYNLNEYEIKSKKKYKYKKN